MLVYHITLTNSSEAEALDYCRDIFWSEIETTKQNIKYFNHIETIGGVGVYYDYGADYYFFTDETQGDG